MDKNIEEAIAKSDWEIVFNFFGVKLVRKPDGTKQIQIGKYVWELKK